MWYLPLSIVRIDEGALGADLASLNMSSVNKVDDFVEITGILKVNEGETSSKTSFVSGDDDLVNRGELSYEVLELRVGGLVGNVHQIDSSSKHAL